MRFLLTSAGIKNASIHDALVDLLGKPIAGSKALCIPTATHALECRRNAVGGRLFDVSAPGLRGPAGEHHGRRRKVGRRHAGAAYAIDDQTAIKVTEGTVDVVSEGQPAGISLDASRPSLEAR